LVWIAGFAVAALGCPAHPVLDPPGAIEDDEDDGGEAGGGDGDDDAGDDAGDDSPTPTSQADPTGSLTTTEGSTGGESSETGEAT